MSKKKENLFQLNGVQIVQCLPAVQTKDFCFYIYSNRKEFYNSHVDGFTGISRLITLGKDIKGETGLNLYEHKGIRPSNDSQELVPALRLSLKNVLQMPKGI